MVPPCWADVTPDRLLPLFCGICLGRMAERKISRHDIGSHGHDFAQEWLCHGCASEGCTKLMTQESQQHNTYRASA